MKKAQAFILNMCFIVPDDFEGDINNLSDVLKEVLKYREDKLLSKKKSTIKDTILDMPSADKSFREMVSWLINESIIEHMVADKQYVANLIVADIDLDKFKKE